ncbi:MAG: TIGR03905 family TSCPD domain-containing protein [Bacteroidales bacterium]|nr:TIGR03905 family TSCPD domain-containing protein [Bacteroidales bacterium]MBP5212986.1 TIGR03905 family TSCPD domain-containing protein [Bacteroidales bacterium]
MKEVNYVTCGTCAKMIHVELDDSNIIQSVQFVGGCHGNTQGISALVKGQKAEDVISRVRGIRCGNKPTSCPDQLSYALEQAMK